MQTALLSLAVFVCADAGLALGAGAPPAASPPVPAAIVVAAADPSAPTSAEPAAQVVTEPEELPEDLVFAGESDDAVAQRVIDYLDRLDTLQGDFTQIAPSGSISTGRFYLRRPGLLRFEYDPPSPLLIVATGGMVFVRDDELETTDSYPVGKTPLKFLLRKRVELADARLVAVDRGPDSAAVTFAFSEDGDEGGEISLIVSAPEVALERWVVRDPQSGITIVSLENVVAGEPIPNRLFAAPEASSPFLKN